MQKYKLRPHHGLCINFYEGKGYSPEFTENMTAVIEALDRENPETEITLNNDVICRKCPNAIDDTCRSIEKVSFHDKKVMDLCGLSDGDKILWRDFQQKVHDRIINIGKLKEVCGDCRWLYICEKKGQYNL